MKLDDYKYKRVIGNIMDNARNRGIPEDGIGRFVEKMLAPTIEKILELMASGTLPSDYFDGNGRYLND